MIDHDKNVGTVLQGVGRPRHRQRTPSSCTATDNGPHMNIVAGWRYDAIPQREELELGRRLSGAGDVPLAGQDQAGSGVQRDSRPSRLAADAPGRCRRHRGEDKLLNGYQVGDMTYKVHLDGDNLGALI
jgi:arylsulfatase